MRLPLEGWRAQCHALCASPGVACFVRRLQGESALFVSDLPRRGAAEGVRRAMAVLAAQGFLCWEAPAGLLLIDASLSRYQALLASLPAVPPPWPARDALHPAYALCRLLLAHPAPLPAQPLGPLRQMLKWAEALSAEALLQKLPSFHADCAARLRLRLPLPQGAGRVLAAWLNDFS